MPISIENVSAEFIVDTGAAVTILSTKIFNQIPQSLKPVFKELDPRLKLEVANDGLLQVTGLVTLTFKIQKDIFTWDVFIAPIREDGLLGLDFLQNHNYALSALSGLKLNKKRYSTNVHRVPYRAIRVTLKEETILPAYSEIIAFGECLDNQVKSEFGLVSPIKTDSEVDYIVGHSLVDPRNNEGTIPIRIMNPTNSDIVLNERSNIGQIHEVETVTNRVTQVSSTPDNFENSAELPEHLHEMYENSIQNLNVDERGATQTIIDQTF